MPGQFWLQIKNVKVVYHKFAALYNSM